MKVQCIGNRGSDLPLELIPIVGFPQSVFDLEIGRVYTVYAISSWKNALGYLLMTVDAISPSWYPADLFKVIDSTIPRNWHFMYYGFYQKPNRNGLVALWGYDELIQNENHYGELTEVEPDAVETFFIHKKEMDSE